MFLTGEMWDAVDVDGSGAWYSGVEEVGKALLDGGGLEERGLRVEGVLDGGRRSEEAWDGRLGEGGSGHVGAVILV